MDDIAIKVDSLYKEFKLPHEKQSSLKGAFINLFRGKRSFERQKVLNDITFEINKGEFFGIVGRNGSGKSTLLKLLAGIYQPNKGSMQVNGKLTPFIELGVGFNQELTGRENVFLNGALLGFSRIEMDEMYDDIVDFAELHRFMDQKLKNYSSGMQVRLAFSIAVRAKSDILLIDEVLAVGDAIFQKKCYDYFKELKKFKKTVVFISHDSNALLQFCDRGILIENGNIISQGNITKVVNDYSDVLNAQEEQESLRSNGKQESDSERWGNGDIIIAEAATYGQDPSKKQTVFTDQDRTIKVLVNYKAQKDCKKPIYGITITDATGQRFFTSNTVWSKIETSSVKAGDELSIEWDIPNIFNTTDYYVAPSVASEGATFDWREKLIKLKIRKKHQSSGVTNVEHKITIRTNNAKNKQ